MTRAHDAIARAHRDEWARVVAALTRRFGDLGIAEEATADAFTTAVERWPVDGVPSNPGAWLTTTAHRKAIDWIRRENKRDDKQGQAQMLRTTNHPIRADLLRRLGRSQQSRAAYGRAIELAGNSAEIRTWRGGGTSSGWLRPLKALSGRNLTAWDQMSGSMRRAPCPAGDGRG